MAKREYPWIVAYDATKGRDAYSLECLRCGAVQRFEPPIAVDYWCRVARAFERQHRRCREPEPAATATRNPEIPKSPTRTEATHVGPFPKEA